jgi:hypothetical protein
MKRKLSITRLLRLYLLKIKRWVAEYNKTMEQCQNKSMFGKF